MKTILSAALGAASVLVLGTACADPAAATTAVSTVQGTFDEAAINAPYDAFLERYIVEENGINLLRYGAVSAADRASLEQYVTTLEGLRPSQMSEDQQLAYYANIYNAKTLVIILDNYPVDSIRDIGGSLFAPGPWRDEVLTIEGQRLSLDNIEHDRVRANFDEPRVHYAFNCASIGCPNLMGRAWNSATLDEDLDAGGRAFVNNARGVRVENGRVTASKIYDWFEEDFGDNKRDVLNHIRQYADDDLLAALDGKTTINRYEYDWNLNLAE